MLLDVSLVSRAPKARLYLRVSPGARVMADWLADVMEAELTKWLVVTESPAKKHATFVMRCLVCRDSWNSADPPHHSGDCLLHDDNAPALAAAVRRALLARLAKCESHWTMNVAETSNAVTGYNRALADVRAAVEGE